MDISNRGGHAQPAAPSGPNVSTATAARRGKPADDNKWGRIALLAGLVAIAVLLISIIVMTAAGNSGNKAEASYVDTNKLQAVFLNTGQVYFGNIKSLNNKYFTLSNIYYLQTNSTGDNAAANANPNVTLVKLGCELHEPNDLMVINRDQVTFWENLHDSGQVAKAVAEFKKNNPQGQKCADQSTSSSTNSTNATQNATTNNSSNTNTNR
jgi:hypothetical protein